MGYSKSPHTLRRIEQHIVALSRGETVRWTTPFPLGILDPSKWAYKIREALHVANRNPERFPLFARFAQAYAVEILDEKTVQASVTAQSHPANVAVEVVSSKNFPFMEAAPITFAEIRSRFEIAQQILACGETNGPLYFPSAQLDASDLTKLAAWAKECVPPWTVLKPMKGSTAITLTRDTTLPENVRV